LPAKNEENVKNTTAILHMLLSHTSSKTQQAIAIWEISGVVDFILSAYFVQKNTS
jgi:hypothetical protein